MTDTGAAQQGADKAAIRPFQFNFTNAELADLRKRINATKWPQRELVNDASQGVQLATMQKLASYWGKDYDWRKGEAKLKTVPHFITEIDGLDIHFIHVRSKHLKYVEELASEEADRENGHGQPAIWDKIEAIMHDVPDEVLATIPTDGSINVDITCTALLRSNDHSLC